MTPAVGFDGYENGVDIFQRLWVFRFRHPSLLADIVLVEDAEIESLLFVRASSAPCLEGTYIANACLCVQIARVENQRFSFCVEDTTVGLVRLPGSRHIMDFGYVQVTSTHQFSNIPVVIKQVLLLGDLVLFLIDCSLAIPHEPRQVVNLRLQGSGA